ncbi:ankyrin repeat-containing protein BDA1 [Medicago truncatula]|uniref:ankyrin repeat-containing protein BDA1 n=1 Tax=Medicago truncatula TaxID=3880 RepID=UPI000D2F3FBA|nr:ankyrin repeat-containing protein BDA1 [Medicago truncatula]
MGHVQFATEIMRLKPSFALKLNQQGFSPIHLALQNNQKTLHIALNQGTYFEKSMVLRFVDMNKELVRIKGREGLTPLHIACQNGEVDLVANFLFVCPNSIQDVTVRGETALHVAIKNKQYNLKTNRQKGAGELEKLTLNCMDEMGNTILPVSSLNNDSKVSYSF